MKHVLLFDRQIAAKTSKEDNQKFQAVGLLNNVIKKANQNSSEKPMIRIELLLEDLLSILKIHQSNAFIRAKFGSYAVQILFKRVLSVPQYFPYIPVAMGSSETASTSKTNMWKVMLKMSTQLFELIPENLDFHSCCALFHSILHGGRWYTDLLPLLRKSFDFFEKVILSARLEKSSVETKHLFMQATNVFLMSGVCQNSRKRACLLGENVMRHVIGMYDEKGGEEVVKFLRIQIALHHPGGAMTEEEGAFCHLSRNEWNDHLLRIYANLIDTTIQNQRRANRGHSYSNRYVIVVRLSFGEEIYLCGTPSVISTP